MRYLPLLLVLPLTACNPNVEQTQALTDQDLVKQNSATGRVYRVGGLDFRVVEANFTPGVVYLAIEVGNPSQEALVFHPSQISATIGTTTFNSDLSKIAGDKLEGEISPGMQKLIVIPFRLTDPAMDLKGTKELRLKLGQVRGKDESLKGEFDQMVML